MKGHVPVIKKKIQYNIFLISKPILIIFAPKCLFSNAGYFKT